ncbi:hypothetical protein QE152_g38016 [Popillia japonica]|uniref:CUB domain-containing protein n=1 Tax=Popillia japonica TaxID=7064 RepID=A0AAW1I9E5_POPJA
MCFLLFLLLYIQLMYICYGSFIELTDMSDNLANIWSNRIPTYSHQTKCTDGGTTASEGVCKTRTQCLLSGGVPRGRCGLLSTCCTYDRVRSSNSKVSYFSSTDVQFTESPISFNVIRMNSNVCQLRLDFVEFDLAPVNRTQIGSNTGQTIYQCSVDNFYVIPGANIPQLCGDNTAQHLYINMPAELRNVTLNVKYTIRSSDLPRWNIKITQLQCPRVTDKFVTIENGVAEDFLMIAPQGCLQYYTKERINAYASNQEYAICFKRTDYYCGISFTIRDLRLNSDLSTTCRDFLMVPGLQIGTEVRDNNKLCRNTQTSNFNTMTTKAPGPLHMNFYAGNNNDVGGFNIDYNLDPCSY